jgi:hypothetical protein
MSKYDREADQRECERLEAEALASWQRWDVWNKAPTVGPPRSCKGCGGTGKLVYGDGELGPCLPCGGSGRAGAGAVWDPHGFRTWC